MAKVLCLLVALLAVASASRVKLGELTNKGRSLTQSVIPDAIVVPWRVGVNYQTIYLAIGQAITFRWADETHSIGIIPSLGECAEFEPLDEPEESGDFTVIADEPGTTVYASGVPGDCEVGLQIVVVVTGSAGAPAPEPEGW